ncbi:peptidoglycan-binding domain-containing protein [uncultured Litoreibacter sp.]|uniref:peptidoglycan-binding domain-containing protein n=1 Tax=uncultured Litoreibacter sp. TaxID=1392394 RepID=UPI00262013E8|nr:peptidoglycan-binding domain-containing protein [uncultured Litoreibacter sp.]
MTRQSLAAFLLMSAPAWAGDLALVVGNDRYSNGPEIVDESGMLDAVKPLESAGFDVLSGANMPVAELVDLVSQLNAKADGTGRVIIAVTGHFAHSATGNWLLGSDAQEPDLATIHSQSIPISTLLEIAGRATGGAVVALGVQAETFPLGAGVTASLGRYDIPQGVAVVTGPTVDVSKFVAGSLTVRGHSVAAMLEGAPNLTGSGFMAPLVAFLPSDGTPSPVVPKLDPDAKQKAFWSVTQEIGSQDSYEAYLERFPEGIFADQANTQIERILAEPLLLAQAGEAALKLDRDKRREIQRGLSLLEYDPKGIDGILGKGSRAAIAKWQEANNEAATSYLTLAQIERLQAQADRRSRELEEEARIRQEELERKDRAYWRASGKSGDEPGLRTYLEKYPDGVFAEIALARLQPFEEARRSAAAAQDRADWDAAVSVGSLAAYEGYLQANPQGAFAVQARTQIAEQEFEAKNANALRAAARNEQRLGLSSGTQRLVEDRLRALGLKPGAVDGVFDEDTRRAVRRYQEARQLPRTGYLDQKTLVRLLADSVLR